MLLTDTGGGRDFEPIPAGQYPAICDMMVDLGVQPPGPNSRFGSKHKLYFRFQVPEQRIKFEKDGDERDLPAVIGVQFTASLSEKSHLRPFLESWRGKAFTPEELRGFDPRQVAGAAAYINIIHEPGNKNGKAVVYANISSIMPLPKGMKVELEGDGVVIHDDQTDSYDLLPKWLQEKLDNQEKDGGDPPVGASGNGRGGGVGGPAAFDTDLDDSVPF